MSGYIYEVKMQVHSQVYDEYLPWLKTHIAEMLKLGCFTGAELLEELCDGEALLRALYYYNKPEDFQEYLDNYAEKMRSHLSLEIKNKITFSRQHYKRL